jgi:hypothetical protein
MHSSAQAVRIGRQQFKDLCVATGIDEQVTDVEVFKFIPCRIRVGIEIDKQGVYPDKNRVSRVLPLEQTPKAAPSKTAASPAAATTATATATAPATTAPKPTAASANGTTPPWRKPKPTLAEEMGDEIPH